MNTPRRTLTALSVACTAIFALPAAAHAQPHAYPYTLIDPGTFGGPQSFLDWPAVPLTADGTLLGQADTSTLGPDNHPVLHAFKWRDGRLSDLGALPGNNNSAVFEMNGAGVGVGGSDTTIHDPYTGRPSGHAVLFVDRRVTDLGALPGGYQAFAVDINDRGQVSGMSSNGTPDPYTLFFDWGTQARSFIWQHGVMTDIGTLGGPDAVMTTLNGRGQIAGQSYLNSTPNPATGTPTLDPFLWQNGRMQDLGTLGGTFGLANWLNNAGDVVGSSDLAGDQESHPFLWKNGTMRDLGTLGGRFGFSTWVNDGGQVVGGAQTSDGTFHGFLWRDDTMIDLPIVGDTAQTIANGVNNQGRVVGVELDANFNEEAAILWAGGHGYDLNTLVAPSSLKMTSAFYINDHGDIVGHGVLPDGSQRVFLLKPNPSVPLPTASTAARPLPATGPRDGRANALMLAQHAPNRPGAAAAVNRQLLLSHRR